MPISATFQADFTLFTAQVAIAETKLVSFEANATKVANSLSAMEKSISGVSIVQAATVAAEAVERLGGVSKLTNAELQRVGATAQEAADKLRAMGKAVPDNIQNLADRARGASEEMLRLAGATKDTAEASTGWSSAMTTASGVLAGFGISLGVTQLVQWGKAGAQALLGMAEAIIANAGALSDMSAKTGLSVEELQKFAEVGAASGATVDDFSQAAYKLGLALEGGDTPVVDAVKRLGLNYQALMNLGFDEQMNTVAKALEGVSNVQERNRLGVDLMQKSYAGISQSIDTGFSEAMAKAAAASKAQIDALDGLGDAWDTFVARRKNQAAALAGSVVLGAEAFANLSAYQKLLVLLSGDVTNVASTIERLARAGQASAAAVEKQLPKERERVTQTKAQAEAADKYAAAWAELNSIGGTFAETLAGLDPVLANQITYYLKIGASVSEVAAAYPQVAEAQIKALDGMIKAQQDYAKTLAAVKKIEFDFVAKEEAGVLGLSKTKQDEIQRWTDAEKAGMTAINKLRADEHDYILKTTLSSTDYQIAKINEAAQAEIKAFQGTSAQVEEHTTRVLAAAKRQADGIIAAASDALDVVAKKGMDAMAILNLAANQAQRGLAVDVVGNAQTAGLSSGVGMQAPIYVAPPIFARAAGGPVSSGQPYLVGERGPELFVPTASGGIVPNGRAGVVQNIVIHVNGTAADVARKVSDEIMRSAMRGQQFGAS